MVNIKVDYPDWNYNGIFGKNKYDYILKNGRAGFPGSKIISMGIIKDDWLPLWLLVSPEYGCVLKKMSSIPKEGYYAYYGEEAFDHFRILIVKKRLLQAEFNCLNINYLEAVWNRYKRYHHD